MARAIDSEAAYRFLSEQLVKETGAFSKGVNKGLNIARSAMRNPDAIPTLTPPNEPLTIQQLREMDGEPVYLVAPKYGISEWNVLNGMDEIVLAYDEPVVGMKAVVPGIKFINGRVFGVGSYGEDWLAYHRPPEGEEDT